jgi:hypothetical protein
MSIPASKSKLLQATPRDILQRALEVTKKQKAAKYEIATLQARNGVGMQFQRKNWKPDCYFEVTKVNVQPVRCCYC